jgi:hypothetical protein
MITSMVALTFAKVEPYYKPILSALLLIVNEKIIPEIRFISVTEHNELVKIYH